MKYIEELICEIEKLDSIGDFDDPTVLQGLYQIINKYYKSFIKTYRQ